MSHLDRRQLLCAGLALTLPAGMVPGLAGCRRSQDRPSTESAPDAPDAGEPADPPRAAPPKLDAPAMKVHYLEIVTPDVEGICTQYTQVHGLSFADPDPHLGGARVAKLEGGGLLGVRGPLRDDESPVVRPYVLVEDIAAAVTAATAAGAELALPPMPLAHHGTCAIVVQGGIDCGLWQL